jgi:hypothetical protein
MSFQSSVGQADERLTHDVRKSYRSLIADAMRFAHHRNKRKSVKSKRNSFPSVQPKPPIGNGQLWRSARSLTLLHAAAILPEFR